jgi:D-alanyl-D-alanine carboxypeptidase (penicillin-binding protein 5/6)
MSAYDLALLAWHIITDFPEYYYYFSQKEFMHNNIKQENRNDLLRLDIGVDGLKTGTAVEAGYGATYSAVRRGRRLILVINGLANKVERSREAERLLNFGFKNFDTVTLFTKDTPITEVKIFKGQEKKIGLVTKTDVRYTLSKADLAQIKISVVKPSVLIAPIHGGKSVANLKLYIPSLGEKNIELYVARPVKLQPHYRYVMSRLVGMLPVGR